MTKIIMEDRIVNNIPILSVYQSELKKCPLIFYLHGYGGDREQALDFGYMHITHYSIPTNSLKGLIIATFLMR
ncbi:hypothetical protein [Metasolibacillus meyeri]|uniref:hypothetical protein n=1 Tax=Metasolibacillus meyeri TaxID=1071052 RepID=UPI000D32273D|nr:hypothetical protein [Metasolibacillus meyeri]